MKIPSGMIDNVTECNNKKHTLKGKCGKHGIEIRCQDCDSLLLWPMPNVSNVNHSLGLYVELAMRYDTDGTEIDELLLDGGFEVVDNSNFKEAYDYVKFQLSARPTYVSAQKVIA